MYWAVASSTCGGDGGRGRARMRVVPRHRAPVGATKSHTAWSLWPAARAWQTVGADRQRHQLARRLHARRRPAHRGRRAALRRHVDWAGGVRCGHRDRRGHRNPSIDWAGTPGDAGGHHVRTGGATAHQQRCRGHHQQRRTPARGTRPCMPRHDSSDDRRLLHASTVPAPTHSAPATDAAAVAGISPALRSYPIAAARSPDIAPSCARPAAPVVVTAGREVEVAVVAADRAVLRVERCGCCPAPGRSSRSSRPGRCTSASAG